MELLEKQGQDSFRQFQKLERTFPDKSETLHPGRRVDTILSNMEGVRLDVELYPHLFSFIFVD